MQAGGGARLCLREAHHGCPVDVELTPRCNGKQTEVVRGRTVHQCTADRAHVRCFDRHHANIRSKSDFEKSWSSVTFL